MKRLNILVVDDDRFHADALVELFEIEGHHAVAVYDGEQAITWFRAHPVDLTFLDIKLPGMNGLECSLRMRRHDPEARVVLMTGYPVEQVLAEAAGNGTATVLRVPLRAADVLAGVEQVGRDGIVVVDGGGVGPGAAVCEELTAAGRKAVVVDGDEQALNAAVDAAPEILVLELGLPLLRVLEVYLRLKEKGLTAPTVLAAEGYEGKYGDRYLAGVDSNTGILFKPIPPLEMLRLVGEYSRNGNFAVESAESGGSR